MLELPANLPRQVWLGYDWSQAELYALTLFSQDQVLKDALYSQDVHRYVIHRLYNIPMEDVTSKQRDLAKIISYALIYSGFDLDTTRAIVFRKSNGTLDMAAIDEALQRYQQEFHGLFDWVSTALVDWFQHAGEVRYLFGARKVIRYPDYQRPDLDSLRRSKYGRVAVNTYGQNSIGLLLKWAYAQIFRDDFLRDNTTQHIPVFDAMSMLVTTAHIGEIFERLNRIVTPVLRFNGFEVQMKAEWKIGLESWGQASLLDVPARAADPIVLEWSLPNREAPALPPLHATVNVNPFSIV